MRVCVSQLVCLSVSVYITVHACDACLREMEPGSLGAPLSCFSPFRLKLNSKRSQLVRELEEAALQVAALHSQLKR